MRDWRLLAAFLAVMGNIVFAQDQASPSPVSPEDLLAIKANLVERYPELAGSPGYLHSHLSPSYGAPGCEKDGDETATAAIAWRGVAGTRELTPVAVTPTCRPPVADVFFAPFRESSTRQDGAFVRCRAPVTDRATPPPWDWTCGALEFRQYVRLEGQECTVTLVGELSDSQLMWFKEAGLATLDDGSENRPDTLVKVHIAPGGRANAIFGDRNCLPGSKDSSAFFLADEEGVRASEETWRLVDIQEWADQLNR